MLEKLDGTCASVGLGAMHTKENANPHCNAFLAGVFARNVAAQGRGPKTRIPLAQRKQLSTSRT